MAVLKNKDVKKMDKKEIESKLKELKMNLIKGSVTANRTNAKTKEIKRAISRLLTSSNLKKLEDQRTASSMISNSQKEALNKK